MERSLTRRHALLAIVALAIGLAMLSTLAFCVRVVYLLTLGGGFAGLSRDVFWMSPLSYLVLYGLVSVPLVVAGWWLRPDRAFRIAVFVLVAAGFFDLMIPFSALASLAVFLLALGVGAVAARRITPPMARTLLMAGIPIAGVLVIASSVMVWRTWSTSRSDRGPATAAAGAPNVLLIIWDTVRAQQLSLYGYNRETTPGLTAVASQGATFDAAVATAPWTLASHATMFTGRYPQYLDVGVYEKFSRPYPTLAEIFRGAGYRTVGVSANLFFASWESGLERGFADWYDYRRDTRQLLRSSMFGQTRLFGYLITSRSWGELMRRLKLPALFFMPRPTRLDERDARDITSTFLRWRDQKRDTKPWFAFLNYIDAHRPYRPPPGKRTKFAKQPTLVDVYDGEINFIDEQVTRLLADLEKRGDLKNTLVIITSDHGEHFGERGLQEHSNSVYSQTVHVPLVLRFDGHIPAGVRVSPAVSLRDLGATMLQYAGVTPRQPFPGVSLARYWTDAPDSGSVPVAQLGVVSSKDLAVPDSERMEVAVLDDAWHLVRYGPRPLEELFAYRTDPTERTSVLGADAARGVPERLRETLRKALAEDRPPGYRSRRRTRADTTGSS